MEKNKRNKIIGLSIGILVVLIIVVSSTYAYWQITKTQKSPNDIVAACLSLELKDASTENTGIDLDSAWPISDEEGKSLAGYTFTVTNNCAEEINYIVGLNRVEASDSNYLADSSIKLQLDDNSTFLYSDLSDVEYADAENTEYTARTSKQVSVETIGANGTNTHTIRVWISEDAPVTEQSKTFLGQVFITGGQGIEIPALNECFTIANNGTLLGYDESCGTEVVVPAEINGIQVKEIIQPSFVDYDFVMFIINSISNEEESNTMFLIMNTEEKENILNFIKNNFCEDPTTCNLEDMAILLEGLEEYNAFDWENYVITEQYTYSINFETNELDSARTKVKSLDLSETIYLKTIGEEAFYMSDGKIGVLEKVILPTSENLTTIGRWAFQRNQIKEMVIPYTIEKIESHAFNENPITSLTFEDTEENPSRLTIIDGGAFNSTHMSKVVIPASVTTIGFGAFGISDYGEEKYLEEVVIKRTEADALANMTLEDGWYGKASVTITYNPDYTE